MFKKCSLRYMEVAAVSRVVGAYHCSRDEGLAELSLHLSCRLRRRQFAASLVVTPLCIIIVLLLATTPPVCDTMGAVTDASAAAVVCIFWWCIHSKLHPFHSYRNYIAADAAQINVSKSSWWWTNFTKWIKNWCSKCPCWKGPHNVKFVLIWGSNIVGSGIY